MKKILSLLIVLSFLISCASSSKEGVIKQDMAESSSSSSSSGSTESKGQLLSGFESVDDWTTAYGESASISTKPVEGKVGKAVEITYDIGQARQWVAIHNYFDIDPSVEGSFKFWIKGSGKVNNIEFKVVDADDGNFLRYFSGMTARKNWTPVVVPLKSLQYGWGGDKRLDMITQVWISVTHSQGGAGTLVIDNLEFIKK